MEPKGKMPLLPGPEQRQYTSTTQTNNTLLHNGDQEVISIRDAAMRFLSLGFSVIPAKPDKAPAIRAWKQYQSNLMSFDHASSLFESAASLGVICGSISGNLECLDFDKPDLYSPFMESLASIDSGLASRMVVTQTQSGGYHVLYRCVDPVEGNQKLAMSDSGDTWIETRGEGGHFLTVPSPNYRLLHNDFDCIPVLTSGQRQCLISLAQSFTEKSKCSSFRCTNRNDVLKPGDYYNQQANSETWKELLIGSGWKDAGKKTEYGVHLTRPGKDSGTSARWKGGYLHVFSTNAGIPPGSHSAFSVYAHVRHGGDYSAAAKELSKQQNSQGPSSQVRHNPDDWPDPQPIIKGLQSNPYPIDALPSIVREAVVEVQSFIKAPIALVAASAQGAMSLAVQALVDVKRAERLTGPVSLFLLTIADSGERKSTCDKLFTSAFSKYHQEQSAESEMLQQRYRADFAAWNAKQLGVTERIKKLTKEGACTEDAESELAELEQGKPNPPLLSKLIRGDETPENLAWSLASEWPSAGLISSEAGVIFGGHGMRKDSIMSYLALLNVLWDGGEHSVGRKTSDSFTLRDARLTVALQIQEPTIRQFLQTAGDMARGTGFLARFLIFWPESNQGVRMFTEPPTALSSLEEFENRILEILRRPVLLNSNGKGLAPVMLSLSDGAYDAWVHFHDKVERELNLDGEFYDVRDVASKAADNVARMAGIFHVLSGNPYDLPIDRLDVESAGEIVLWHLYEARRFLEQIGISDDQQNALKLDSWLAARCRRMNSRVLPVRDIQQFGPNGLRRKDEYGPALSRLANLDRIQIMDNGKSKTVELNPRLLDTAQELSTQ